MKPFSIIRFCGLMTVLLCFIFNCVALPAFAAELPDDWRAVMKKGIYYYDPATCADVAAGAEIANTPGGGGPVYMLGDSITFGAEKDLEREFKASPATDIYISGRGARSFTSPGVKDRPGQIVGTHGDQSFHDGLAQLDVDKNKSELKNAKTVVIALGTNADTGSFKDHAKSALKKIQDLDPDMDPKIYWVNLFQTRKDKFTVHKAEYNKIIKELENLPGLPPVEIIDADNYSPRIILSDGIHPKANGYKTYAKMIAEAVKKDAVVNNDSATVPVSLTAAEPAKAASDKSTTNLGKLPAKSQKVFDAAKKNIDIMRPVYEKAAAKTKIPWEYLAALHYRESNNTPGTSVFAGEPLGSSNPDGVGDTGGTDAVANAVKAAEHFIGNAKGVYKVDPTKDQSFEDLQKAFVAYNRGYIYQRGGVSPDKSAYVMSGYDEEHGLPMPWAILPAASGYTEIAGSDARLGAMSILAGLGIGLGGSSKTSSTACPAEDDAGGGATSSSSCDNIGQSADKFTFPLCTTQTEIQKGSVNDKKERLIWCFKAAKACHHDYAAADVHVEPNTMVIAALGGTVYKVDDPGKCDGGFGVPRVQIKASDGKFYYYTHMKPSSIVIKEGQKIAEGDKVGLVGPTACAQGAAPHLHIHRGSAPTACAGTAGCAQHADFNANDIQPDLHKAYDKLPPAAQSAQSSTQNL